MQVNVSFTSRYAETDQMGIIHHSNYPIWFEVGRTEFFRAVGIHISKIESQGILLPLSHMECSFKTPAKYEDVVIVKTQIIRMTCVRIKFDYQIVKSTSNKILALGNTSHAWTDRELKPINIEKKDPDLYTLLKSTIE